ncbi:MAG: tRNA lysidine(34) synthetase TilS [Kiritimatiellaeota bacterium]|nr:tRNA lysidine(34) synthetase TilS [Kiritimatiellota bacterium]
MMNAIDANYCSDPSDIAAAVQQMVQSHHLLRKVRRLGIAVSGGADSIALFWQMLPLCREREIEPIILHLNHGLREASAHEEQFVREMAAEAGVTCLSETRKVVPLPGVSLEMMAREVRQSFYAACCASAQLDAVATGHNADDVAETVLLRLARGAGAAGLSALGPHAEPAPALLAISGYPYRIIRPLLGVSGRAIRDWLRQLGGTWCEDASNANMDIPRNRVRHEVLPSLEKALGTALRSAFCRTSEILREEDALLDTLARRQFKRCVVENALSIRPLLKQHLAIQRRVVRQWLFGNDAAFSSGFATTEFLIAICKEGRKTRLQLTDHFYAVSNGKTVVLVREDDPAAPVPLEIGGECRWRNLVFSCKKSQGINSIERGIGNYPALCTISRSACCGRPLIVRSRQPGDRLTPYGLGGKKKVQDILVDAKVPEHLRDTIPLVSCGDEVVWIPGFRISQPFALRTTDAPCLRIEAEMTRD